MGRDRIVNQGADAGFGQFLLQRVAPGMADGKHMPDRFGPGGNVGQGKRITGSGKLMQVSFGNFGAAGVPLVQVAEFDAEESGLQFVQTRIQAGFFVLVFDLRAVVAQAGHARRQLGVIGGDGAGIAEGAENFCRIKAERGGIAQGAGTPAFVARALRLGRVLHHFQLMPAGDFQDWIHVRRLAVKMHRQNGPGARSNGRLDEVGIQIVSLLAHVHRHRRGPGEGDTEPGGDESMRRHDDLVARPDVATAQNQVDCIQPVSDAEAVFDAAVLGKLGFKRLQFAAKQVPA